VRYYYFNPFNKQYYFPEGFQQHPLLTTFYQPYTFAGSLLWFAWKNSSLVRRLCREESIESVVPIDRFQKYLPTSAIMAINRGTLGIEQKMSVLAYDPVSGDEFFIKYAESEIARGNVDNEGKVLAQLNHLDFVPKLNQQASEEEYSLIQTSILKGERLTKQKVDDQILDVLSQLSSQKVKTDRIFASELQYCFAHGDFCPWNMMLDKDQLNVFDWEMAGIYPLGYDLFTFIFQTSFLLSAQKSIGKVLQENLTLIEKYFKIFKIKNWQAYLLAFASAKINLETPKENQFLLFAFQELKIYVEKI
jgi:hypothetical protein